MLAQGFAFSLTPPNEQTPLQQYIEIRLRYLASFGMQKHVLSYFPAYLSGVSQPRAKGGFTPSCQTARKQRELGTHLQGEELNIPHPLHNYTRPSHPASRPDTTRPSGFGSAAALQTSARLPLPPAAPRAPSLHPFLVSKRYQRARQAYRCGKEFGDKMSKKRGLLAALFPIRPKLGGSQGAKTSMQSPSLMKKH